MTPLEIMRAAVRAGLGDDVVGDETVISALTGTIAHRALDALVAATGGPDHVVRVDEDGHVTVQHPLGERLDGSLFECGVLSEVLRWDPLPPGDYRVWRDRFGFLRPEQIEEQG